MKIRVILTVTMVLVLVSLVLASCAKPASAPEPAEEIPVLLAGPPAVWGAYAQTIALADLVTRNSNLNITVRSQEGSVAIMQAMLEQTAQLTGGIYDSTAAMSYHGYDRFEGKANPSLRTALISMVFRNTWVTKSDSGIKSIADLKGKRLDFATDNPAAWYKPVMEAYGLDPEKDIEWINMPTEEAYEALRLGRIDATWSDFGSELMELGQALGPLVPLPIEPDKWDWVKQNYPRAAMGMYIKTAYPGLSYLEMTGPVPVVIIPSGTVTHAGVSDEIIYTYVKTLLDNIDGVKALTDTLKEFGPDMIQTPSALPYHNGAIKALKEANMWTDEMEQEHQAVLNK